MISPAKGLDALSTESLLVVYERLFGALEQKARRRIVATARARGWDREQRPRSRERELPIAA
jgi:hypothetical protein